MRLCRKVRLADFTRFRQVRQQGRTSVHALVVLCLLPNDLDYSRFGISVSRWVGKAVVRNRTKRRLREAIRGVWSEVLPGWDAVFVARPPVQRQPFADVRSAVAEVLLEAGLLSGTRTRSE